MAGIYSLSHCLSSLLPYLSSFSLSLLFFFILSLSPISSFSSQPPMPPLFFPISCLSFPSPSFTFLPPPSLPTLHLPLPMPHSLFLLSLSFTHPPLSLSPTSPFIIPIHLSLCLLYFSPISFLY